MALSFCSRQGRATSAARWVNRRGFGFSGPLSKGTGECLASGVAQGHGSEGSQRGGQALGWGIHRAARGAGGCAHPRAHASAQPPLWAPRHSLSLLQAVSCCLQEVSPKSWPQGSAWDVISARDSIPGDHSRVGAAPAPELLQCPLRAPLSCCLLCKYPSPGSCFPLLFCSPA